MTRRHYSLTLRLALIFALLAFALLATLGVALYRELERELIMRDDAALIYRADQLRNLLNDSNTLELIRTKPELFQNMMGNRESVLSIAAPGQTPLLLVNPANIELPAVKPVPKDHALNLADVQHLQGLNGVPFATVAVSIDSGDLGSLQLTTGRLMTERTAVLASYRLSVYILASIAALVLALVGYLLMHRGLRPLRHLAQHAQGIGVGNLTERLDSHGAPKELLPMIDAFNTMLERLTKGFVQLGQVSTDMAHELRTPINNLLGETQVALQQNRSIESYQQLLASNVEELERLARMLDNMLFLARTDPASALRQRQELSAAEEVERIADYFEGLASDAEISIHAEGEGVIWAEPILLRRALANLCANAIKYGAPGTELVIQAVPNPEGINLRVSNRGETIAAEHLPRLFERFYRVDESRERSAQSNGLGLSIVATIMQLHNGRYSVSSKAAVTCFELFFPGRGTEHHALDGNITALTPGRWQSSAAVGP
ncbi:heavy metal sensor histidine kinase [Pseudomonas extremaustralis]|jgi:two-component system heavy metal sensor histidine kinase CusS|uniref:Sensor protein n=1 Tax=Pseudomonas extremaustralis TaxID=359110 RepID=A0ABY0MXD8_9PSED|nr:heavy metal sensor histidine kinase [Pseudomonas extremaustralis]EZI25384.1 histidine kinase [Pseudomonas extremaustralis 14-3 substr. 14-3b]SDE67912.1 two-component system, OmpR family, heavy metal sensor histidine kinase CusS [Pseudomonas extremaustralis]